MTKEASKRSPRLYSSPLPSSRGQRVHVRRVSAESRQPVHPNVDSNITSDFNENITQNLNLSINLSWLT